MCRGDQSECSLQETRKPGNQWLCSPRGQVEVTVECFAPAPLPPSSTPWQRESQFGYQGNRLFPWRCWNTWEGQGGFVSAVMKHSPHACLIARVMVPNPTAKAIHHTPIMFNGAFDTVIWPVLSYYTSSLYLCYCSVALQHVQLRPQIARPNKEGTHNCLFSSEINTLAQIYTLSVHTHFQINLSLERTQAHNPFCLFLSSGVSVPTHLCLA